MNVFLKHFFSLIAFFLILSAIYEEVSAYFGYLGMSFIPGTISEFAIVIVYLIVFSLLIPSHINTTVDLFVLSTIVFAVLPAMVFYCFGGYDAAPSLSFIFGGLLCTQMLNKTRISVVRNQRRLSTASFRHILVVLTSLSFLFLLADLGLPSFSINQIRLDNIYDIREEYTRAISRSGTYAINFLSYVFVPALIFIAIKEKRILLMAFVVTVSLYAFTAGGHKTVIGTLLLSIFLTLRTSIQLTTRNIMLGLISFLAIGLALEYSFGNNPLTSVAIRRLFLVPGQMNLVWYNHFSCHQIDFYRENLPLSLFLKSAYDGLAHTMGSLYIKEGVHANASVFFNGFANVKYFSLVLIPIVMVVISKMIQYQGALPRLAFILLIPQVIFWSNTGLPTVLITHGLILVVAACYVAPHAYLQQ